MKRTALLSSVLVIALAGLVTASDERVRIAVSPKFSHAPSLLHVRVRLQPNADNRMLVITADSQDFYRRSDVQLDGDASPATIELDFPEVPGGTYDVKAALIDNTGKQCAISDAQVTVFSIKDQP
jgi:hypothetical protein